MERHIVSVLVTVEVDAFSEQDALEAVHDCFGESACGLNVTDFEVVKHVRSES